MQASAAAEKLKGFKFSKVVISPFLRYDTLPLCKPVIPMKISSALSADRAGAMQDHADCSKLL